MFDSISLFEYLYAGELVIFTLCVILLLKNDRSTKIWVTSNVGAIIATFFISQGSTAAVPQLSVIGVFLTILTAALKAVAFSDQRILRKSNRLANLCVILSCLFAVLIIPFGNTQFRLLFIALGGMFATTSCLAYTLANRRWAGLKQRNFLLAVLATSLLSFFYILVQAYPLGPHTRFVGYAGPQQIQFLLLIVLTFLVHIAFLGLAFARQGREQLLQFRFSSRAQTTMEIERKRQLESAALADEREHLLKMLTHEVRQPLNTAQAALQTVMMQIQSGHRSPKTVRNDLAKAQHTLNSIILSISNSILGATMITQGRLMQLEVIDLCAVAELALMDLDAAGHTRIHRQFDQAVLFAEADPIVLRLAIRNLLENAVKYSPENTPITFDLSVHEDKLAIKFSVINSLIDVKMLDGDIFERNKRGADSRYAGFGLGLYIVKEVAKLHQGELRYELLTANKVRFELSIPA